MTVVCVILSIRWNDGSERKKNRRNKSKFNYVDNVNQKNILLYIKNEKRKRRY